MHSPSAQMFTHLVKSRNHICVPGAAEAICCGQSPADSFQQTRLGYILSHDEPCQMG